MQICLLIILPHDWQIMRRYWQHLQIVGVVYTAFYNCDSLSQRYCKEIISNEGLSYCELNLETWRQLWRVLEMSDILLHIVDVRWVSSDWDLRSSTPYCGCQVSVRWLKCQIFYSISWMSGECQVIEISGLLLHIVDVRWLRSSTPYCGCQVSVRCWRCQIFYSILKMGSKCCLTLPFLVRSIKTHIIYTFCPVFSEEINPSCEVFIICIYTFTKYYCSSF